MEGKLWAWISRRKDSDFQDLIFLAQIYGSTIREWSNNLRKDWREEFYRIFGVFANDPIARRNMQKALCLGQNYEGSEGFVIIDNDKVVVEMFSRRLVDLPEASYRNCDDGPHPIPSVYTILRRWIYNVVSLIITKTSLRLNVSIYNTMTLAFLVHWAPDVPLCREVCCYTISTSSRRCKQYFIASISYVYL